MYGTRIRLYPACIERGDSFDLPDATKAFILSGLMQAYALENR